MKSPKGKKKKKERYVTIMSLLLSIFSILFVVGGSLTIYYFSKGYRVNVSERTLRKTGVLTVQSQPSGARLYINGDDVGRTPRSRTLDIGGHNVSVWREGYREWTKDIEIIEEKSTPIYPSLFLENVVASNIWESPGAVKKHWINKHKDYFVFLQQEALDQFSLWTYRVNTPIWNLNPNPIQILQLETDDIELEISDNGQLAIARITEDEVQKSYIVELTKPIALDNLDPIEVLDASTYEITWSKDNRHIIMESLDEILSLDTTSNSIVLDTPSILLEKELGTEYIWSTDKEGFFYLLEPLHLPEDNTYSYALKQFQPDGTSPKYTIERVHFQKNRDYIEYYRENGDSYPEFTNSPHSTQTIGEVTYFEVNQDTNGVYLSTDTSAYWYDISSKRYRMVCAHPAEIVSFSTDSKKVLFANGNYIYVFTLDKEDGDHTEEIGTKKVVGLRKDEVSNISWLSNSSYIHYIKDNTLHISEKDGENQEDMLGMDNIIMHTIKNSREYIVTLETQEENLLQINQYKIR
jgi:hypothetical protein